MRVSNAFAALLLLLLSMATAEVCVAAEFPTRPIHLYVAFAAGGGADINARIVAQKASEILGQPIIIENRPGAGGNLAPATLASASPDGYSLLQVTITHTIAAAIYKNLKYNIDRDFVPIVGTGSSSYILSVNNEIPVANAKDLIVYAQSGHRVLSGTSGGNGPTDLASKLFASSAGIKIEEVPYTGVNPAVIDLIGGRIQMAFITTATALPLIAAHNIKALGVTSLRRSALAPELPTVWESGLPGYRASTWFGIVAPTGTQPMVLDILHDAFAKALADPEVRNRFAQSGFEIEPTSREQFGAFIKAEVIRWSDIVRQYATQTK
jgi:tripartite-type tricarboxylate transporter receptor subunit TctC